MIERGEHGAFTVRYLEGAKEGLAIHFYTRPELRALTRAHFAVVQGPQAQTIHREPAGTGSWVQWEAVYERRGGGSA